MKNLKKIAIIGANPYSANKGVSALAFSTLYILKEIAEDHKKDFDIYLINSGYGNKKIDLLNIGGKVIQVTNLDPINFLNIKSLIGLFLTPKKWLTCKTYPKINYLLNMGEGDSFSDIYGIPRFKSINGQNILARLFRKKYILLPQTIGPFSNAKVQKQARKSIERAKLVFARDTRSLNYVKKNTRQKKAFEAIDLRFYIRLKGQKKLHNHFLYYAYFPLHEALGVILYLV